MSGPRAGAMGGLGDPTQCTRCVPNLYFTFTDGLVDIRECSASDEVQESLFVLDDAKALALLTAWYRHHAARGRAHYASQRPPLRLVKGGCE